MTIDSKETVKKKRVRRDRTNEILDAATRLFAEHGFNGATLAQVAEAVGLTEAGVLHYFPSKIHLLQGVLGYRDQKDIDKYSKLVKDEINAFSKLFELLEELTAQNEKVPGLVQLFTVLVAESLQSNHPSHDYFVDRYRRGRSTYVDQFLKMNKTKIRSDVDLNELASLIMAVMDGLQIQWLLDPKKVNMLGSFQLFSKIVVEYLDE